MENAALWVGVAVAVVIGGALAAYFLLQDIKKKTQD